MQHSGQHGPHHSPHLAPPPPSYPQQSAPGYPPAGTPRAKRNPLLIPLILVSIFATVMTVLYLFTFIDTSRPSQALAQAVEACPESSYIELVDEGTALLMTTEGNESYGASMIEVACVLDELAMPSNVINRLDTTRALDGTQTGTWDGYEATWNYHPDSGMNLTITLVND